MNKKTKKKLVDDIIALIKNNLSEIWWVGDVDLPVIKQLTDLIEEADDDRCSFLMQRAIDLGIVKKDAEITQKEQMEFDVLTGKPFEEDFFGNEEEIS